MLDAASLSLALNGRMDCFDEDSGDPDRLVIDERSSPVRKCDESTNVSSVSGSADSRNEGQSRPSPLPCIAPHTDRHQPSPEEPGRKRTKTAEAKSFLDFCLAGKGSLPRGGTTAVNNDLIDLTVEENKRRDSNKQLPAVNIRVIPAQNQPCFPQAQQVPSERRHGMKVPTLAPTCHLSVDFPTKTIINADSTVETEEETYNHPVSLDLVNLLSKQDLEFFHKMNNSGELQNTLSLISSLPDNSNGANPATNSDTNYLKSNNSLPSFGTSFNGGYTGLKPETESGNGISVGNDALASSCADTSDRECTPESWAITLPTRTSSIPQRVTGAQVATNYGGIKDQDDLSMSAENLLSYLPCLPCPVPPSHAGSQYQKAPNGNDTNDGKDRGFNHLDTNNNHRGFPSSYHHQQQQQDTSNSYKYILAPFGNTGKAPMTPIATDNISLNIPPHGTNSIHSPVSHNHGPPPESNTTSEVLDFHRNTPAPHFSNKYLPPSQYQPHMHPMGRESVNGLPSGPHTYNYRGGYYPHPPPGMFSPRLPYAYPNGGHPRPPPKLPNTYPPHTRISHPQGYHTQVHVNNSCYTQPHNNTSGYAHRQSDNRYAENRSSQNNAMGYVDGYSRYTASLSAAGRGGVSQAIDTRRDAGPNTPTPKSYGGYEPHSGSGEETPSAPGGDAITMDELKSLSQFVTASKPSVSDAIEELRPLLPDEYSSQGRISKVKCVFYAAHYLRYLTRTYLTAPYTKPGTSQGSYHRGVPANNRPCFSPVSPTPTPRTDAPPHPTP